MINEDEQMLQNSILLLAKILKNDINQIAEEEIISIGELDNLIINKLFLVVPYTAHRVATI